MKIVTSVLFSLFLATGSCYSQGLVSGEELMELADDHFYNGDYAASIKAFEDARSHYKSQRNWDQYVKTFTHLVRVHETTGDHESYLEAMEAGLKFGKELLPESDPVLGICLMLKGEYMIGLGNMDSARWYLNEALLRLKGSDYHEELVFCYSNTSVYNYILANMVASESYLDSAWATAEKFLPEEHIALSFLLDLYSMVYGRLGDFDRSLFVSQKSLARQLKFIQPNPADTIMLANAYGNLGATYFGRGDFSNAILHFQKSLDVFQNCSFGAEIDKGRTMGNLAVALQKEGRMAEAIGLLKQAAPLLRQANNRVDWEEYHFNRTQLAAAHLELDSLQKAEAYLLDALELCERWDFSKIDVFRLMGDLHFKKGDLKTSRMFFAKLLAQKETEEESGPDIDKGYGLLCMGKIEALEGHLESALIFFQRSIDNLTFDEEGSTSTPIEEKQFAGWQILNALHEKGKCLFTLSREGNGGLKELRASLDTYQSLFNLIARFQTEYVDRDSRMLLAENAYAMYEGGIESALALFEESQDSLWLYQALGFSETARATTLLQDQFLAEARGMNKASGSIGRKVETAKRDLAMFTGLILDEKLKGENADQLRLTTWQGKVFDLEQVLHQWEEFVKSNHPESVENFTSIPDRAELSLGLKELGEKEVGLEFFLGQNGQLYTFVGTNQAISVLEQQLPKGWETTILDFRRSIGDFEFVHDSPQKNFETFTRTSFLLYKTLLEPVFKIHPHAEKLRILPDGVLGQVPFEALLVEEREYANVNFLDLPYLFEQVKIEYGSSFKGAQKPANASRSTGSWVAFAPHDSKEMEGGSRRDKNVLKGASEEVDFISELGISGEFYLGDEATEEVFKEKAPQFGLLHLAMHGMPNSRDGRLSKLTFARSGSGGLEDGELHDYELRNLDLNCELVVLSACETGVGNYRKGAGVMSLGRSFLASGAKSIVHTLWKVEDQASGDLIKGFYSMLESGHSSGEALHLAKREFFAHADSRTAHPFYWAGYIASGEGRPFGIESKRIKWWWWAIGVGLLVLAFFGTRVFRTN